ncbi:MAG: hypothetical protein HRT38_16080 [Alteromonadaceae bacterium]|nr:hypothetical protein [Alteromonadaceae bacterium]
MLELYFQNTNTIIHYRAGPLGLYIHGFAQNFDKLGYTKSTARGIINAATPLVQLENEYLLR